MLPNYKWCLTTVTRRDDRFTPIPGNRSLMDLETDATIIQVVSMTGNPHDMRSYLDGIESGVKRNLWERSANKS